MRPLAIAPYPLSRDFRETLAKELGEEPEILDLPSLRRLGIRSVFRELQRHRGAPCVLPLEDPTSLALLPVLELLAVVASPSSITVIHASGLTEPVSRLRAVAAAAGLLEASLTAKGNAVRAQREIAALRHVSRATAAANHSRRALYVNGNLWFGVKVGGSIGHVAGVVNGLMASGLEVDVAAIARQPLVGADASFIRLHPPRRFGMPSELNQYVFSRSSARTLESLVAERSHAFIYQRLSLGNYAGAAVSRSTGVPLVLEYNGSEVWVARHWGTPLRREDLALGAEEVSLRHAHVVVTVSDVLGDELLARGVEPERIVVYPNCVDPAIFDPDRLAAERERRRAELGLAGHTVVTFVGTFGRWHGAEVLAKAINTLAVSDPLWVDRHRVHFLLIGDGLRMPDVREALGEAGHRVTTLAGLVPQRDAPSYLAASDILVSPHVPNEDGSRFFGSPTKLFEYMAMGKAIVASDLDQIGDVLRPALAAERLPSAPPDDCGRELAILARPGDVQSLCTGIRFAVERPDWSAAMGRAARGRVLSRYTWAHHVQAILDRIAETCGSR